MAAPYSRDLRMRVMNDLVSGMSVDIAAEKYSITARTIYSWKAIQQETGSFAPRHGKPGRKRKLEEYREVILAALKENPGLTLQELRSRLQLPGCLQTLWHALRRWGVVLKKSVAGHRTATA